MSQNLSNPQDYTKIELIVAEHDVGKFIGRQGCNFKKLKSQCLADIIFSNSDQVLEISGLNTDVQQSREKVLDFAKTFSIKIGFRSKRRHSEDDIKIRIKRERKESSDEHSLNALLLQRKDKVKTESDPNPNQLGEADYKQQILELEEKLKRNNGKEKFLQRKIEMTSNLLKQQMEKLENENLDLERRNEVLQKENENLRNEAENQNSALTRMQDKIDENKIENENLQKVIKNLEQNALLFKKNETIDLQNAVSQKNESIEFLQEMLSNQHELIRKYIEPEEDDLHFK